MTKDFYTKIKLNAPPEDVYAALTNPFALELWTGYPAKMSTEEGSEFELWEGDIAGRNLRFEENRLIEQQWYFGDEGPESIVTFKIHERGASASVLEVKQTNIPAEDYDDLVGGWQESYLDSLKLFLEEE